MSPTRSVGSSAQHYVVQTTPFRLSISDTFNFASPYATNALAISAWNFGVIRTDETPCVCPTCFHYCYLFNKIEATSHQILHAPILCSFNNAAIVVLWNIPSVFVTLGGVNPTLPPQNLEQTFWLISPTFLFPCPLNSGIYYTLVPRNSLQFCQAILTTLAENIELRNLRFELSNRNFRAPGGARSIRL